MWRKKTAPVMIALALLIVPQAAHAQAQEVSLQEAFHLALKGNPQLVALDNSLKAVQARVGSARGRLLPRVTFEERYMKTDNPTYAFSSKLNQSRFESEDFALESLNDPDAIDDFTTSLSFTQALYSREVSLGVEMARTQSEAVELDYRRAREKVLFDVLEAFIGAGTAKRYLDVAEKGLEDARAHLSIARSRVEAGLGLESDLLRAEVSVRESEERLVSARKSVSLAARGLGLILGLSGPVDAAAQRIPLPNLEPLEHYEAGVTDRNDLKAMARKVHNAQLNVRMAAAPFAPMVGLGGSYQVNSHKTPFDDEGSSYQISAFLRWDLYSGGQRTNAVSDASYSLSEAQAYYDGMKKEAVYRINEAYLTVLEAARGEELATSRLSLADETSRLVEKRYENSLATVVELLDAQTALDSARANLVARENAHLVSMASLLFQGGLIEQSYLTED
jgi:outer membrane protein TolC